MKTIFDYKITDINIREDNSFSCYVDGNVYVGSLDILEWGLKAVSYCRNINSIKQCKAAIKSAIEFKINENSNI